MAKKSLIVKQARLAEKYFAYKAGEGKKPKHITKYYNRCRITGKSKGYMREFGVNMVTFRFLAREGMVMGVKKSSR